MAVRGRDAFALVVAAWITQAWVVDLLAAGAFETNGAYAVWSIVVLDTAAAVVAVRVA